MTDTTVDKTINALVGEASTALSGASTPEEAYKVFMAAAGKGMMQVMAKALAAAAGNTVTSVAGNTAIEGWQKYITGCTMSMDFGSPSFGTVWIAGASSTKDVPSTKLQAAVTSGSAPALLGGSITIGGTWSF